MRKKNTILHNKFGREDLEKQLSQEEFKRTTLSFYKYVKIEDPTSLRKELFIKWNELKVKGRIYIAKEGINAQLSCPNPNWDQFVSSVKSVKGFENIPFKIALEENKISFLKLVIKIKNQIVADGLNENEYDVTNVGSHLSAKEWNECINKGAIVVDVRNHYESRIGHFKGAIKPDVDTFREELPLIKEKLKNRKEEKILLYCTGGIRCEKTSSYLKHHGFKDVNQLHGGIIDYAKQLRTKGKDIEKAVKEACSLRFRPIIMTSLSTMIAMLPLVIGNIGPGAGEGSRLAVGATILGGMIISTFFTLYVTPTMYLTLAKNTKRIDAVDIELKKQLN